MGKPQALLSFTREVILFYSVASVKQYIGESFVMSRSVAMAVEKAVDIEPMANEVMRIYHGLSAEERDKMGTPEYSAHFAQVEQSEDYQTAFAILQEFESSSDIDVYLAMYDEQTDALVYIVDFGGNAAFGYKPGEWEKVESTEIEKFLTWNGEGKLYDLSDTEKYGWMCSSGVPIRNESGKIVTFALADVTLENVISGMNLFALQFTVTMLIATALVLWLLTRHMKKKVVRPINEIAEAANRYTADKKSGSPETEHFAKLNIRTGDEIENLSCVMSDMERELAEYEENLTKEVAEKERIGTELNMAANIQTNMLPNIFPPFPERKEFDIYATMDPAKEVGGDFYDFFMVDEDHLAMVVADVSDKGIPAALFSMIAKTLLKTKAQAHLSPDRVLTEVNASLCENNDANMFVTVWLGILEISTGNLTYADAGHEKLLLCQNGEWSFVPKKGGTALAAFTPEDLSLMGEKYQFRNCELHLNPSDVILQYTDGVTEATTAENEAFGDERFLSALNSAASTKPDELLAHIRAKIDEFVKDAPQFDDITMLGLRFN